MYSQAYQAASRLRHLLRLFFPIVMLAAQANAFEVSLEWDANLEPGVAGYKVYVGSQSRTYDTSIDVGLATSSSISVPEPGCLYYFAVTAYDSEGLESDFSAEVTYLVPIDGTNAFLVPLGLTFPSAASPVAIAFVSEPGSTCFVQASTDLRSWQHLLTLANTSGGTNQWLDADAPNHPMRFYRAVSLPITGTE